MVTVTKEFDVTKFDFGQLSVAERILLVEKIWDSVVDENPQLELSPSEAEELDRRVADFRKNPQAGSTWDEIKARIRAEKK